MHLPPTHHRVPRAGVDPIDSEASALATITLALHRPLRPETIVVLLDDARRGVAIVAVDGTREPDDVVGVVECLVERSVHRGRVAAMTVATVRPCRAADDTPLLDGDVERWLEMSDIAETAGIEVLEWFVIGRSVECPRDLLGEPPRWGARSPRTG